MIEGCSTILLLAFIGKGNRMALWKKQCQSRAGGGEATLRHVDGLAPSNSHLPPLLSPSPNPTGHSKTNKSIVPMAHPQNHGCLHRHMSFNSEGASRESPELPGSLTSHILQRHPSYQDSLTRYEATGTWVWTWPTLWWLCNPHMLFS